jgi:hypothetical protein
MSTATPTADVHAFATAVRQRLRDLPAETVDELTEGLEADLAERLEDDGAELGDPAAYADELRSAAGLPRRSFTISVDDRRALDAIRSFLVAILPAWWVLRGVLVGTLLWLPFGPSAGAMWVLLTLPLVVVSVQWGRGRWLPERKLNTVATIAAGAAGLTIAAVALNTPTAAPPEPWQFGLTYGNAPLENLYAYDCEGRPLDAVQLFDRWGEPVAVDPYLIKSPVTPNDAVGDEPLWNVFPLDQFGDDGTEPPSRVPPLDDCPPSPDEQRQP